MPFPKDRAITLADVAAETPWLKIDCRRCGRAGRLRVDRLIQEHGARTAVWEVVDKVARDCPRKGETQTYQICPVRCPTLGEFSR